MSSHGDVYLTLEMPSKCVCFCKLTLIGFIKTLYLKQVDYNLWHYIIKLYSVLVVLKFLKVDNMIIFVIFCRLFFFQNSAILSICYLLYSTYLKKKNTHFKNWKMLYKRYFFHLGFWGAEFFKLTVKNLADIFSFLENKSWDPKNEGS